MYALDLTHKLVISACAAMKVALMVLGILLLCGVAQAATIEDVKRYGASYLDDLPNFVCNYRETMYDGSYFLAPPLVIGSGLKLKKWHTGELRWNRSDTRWNRKVLTFKGKPTKKKLHQISNTLGNYGLGIAYSHWKWKKSTEQGEGGVQLEVFEVSSPVGVTLHRGLDKHRKRKKARSLPTTGIIWAEKDTGRIRKVVLKYSFEDQYRHDGWLQFEYAYVNIDGKSYLLPKVFTFETRRDIDVRLDRIEHYNYRRFQSKATIRP